MQIQEKNKNTNKKTTLLVLISGVDMWVVILVEIMRAVMIRTTKMVMCRGSTEL